MSQNRGAVRAAPFLSPKSRVISVIGKQISPRRHGDTEEEKTLPRIHGTPGQVNTDGTDQRKGLPLIHGTPGQVNADVTDQQDLEEEFVPLPGGAGYRFTRLRSNVEQEKRPVQGVTPPRAPLPQRANAGLVGDPVAVPHVHGRPHEHAEPHANLG